MQLKKLINKFRTNNFERNTELMKSHLSKGEKLIHVVSGNASSKWNMPCVLALTNERLIRFGRKIFGNDVVTLPISSMTFVDEVSGFREKEVYFYFVNGRVSFYPIFNKDNLQKLDNLMLDLKNRMNKGAGSAVSNKEEDVPTMIRKLAKLHKEGIITKREFEDKKKDLLKRI